MNINIDSAIHDLIARAEALAAAVGAAVGAAGAVHKEGIVGNGMEGKGMDGVEGLSRFERVSWVVW